MKLVHGVLLAGMALVAIVVVGIRSTQPPATAISGNQEYVLNPGQVGELERRARSGNLTDAIKLAKFYDLVLGDRERALGWWTFAAERGNTDAQYTLGILLVDSAVAAEAAQGLHWLKSAAAQGDKGAERALADRHNARP